MNDQTTGSVLHRRQAWSLLAASLLISPYYSQASLYEAGTIGLQVIGSPTPVALTKSESFNNGALGSGIRAGIAAAGPGLANGVATALMTTDPDLTGRTEAGVQSGAFASLDGIVITGPPGTPSGAVVGYTVNLFVTANFSASHSGPGAPYAVANGRVRFGTGSSLGFVGGLELGNLQVQSDGVYVGNGIFSNLPAEHGQGFAATSTSWNARAGDAISIAVQAETSAGVGDGRFDYGPGGSRMEAKASLQVTLTGVSVFNFTEAGWTANSTDGTIVNNIWVPPAASRGDFSADWLVNDADLAMWRFGFGRANASRLDGDADGDYDSDGEDFLIWQRHLGSASEASLAESIPEPASAILVLCSACFIRRRQGLIGRQFRDEARLTRAALS